MILQLHAEELIKPWLTVLLLLLYWSANFILVYIPWAVNTCGGKYCGVDYSSGRVGALVGPERVRSKSCLHTALFATPEDTVKSL